MKPDELRALADALEPMAKAPRFEDFDVPGFCAWVRACAEAKPVAWTARHTSVTRFALWLFINNALARSERAAQKGSYEPVENVAKYQDDAKTAEEARAMLAAAPAAPHHAMLDSHRRLVEQAIHTAEHPSGMSTHDGKARIDASVLRRMLAIIDSLPAAPQAEPKLSGDEASVYFKAGFEHGERAAYERAARVCEANENRIVKTHPVRIEIDPDSMMARKCAAAIRALGRQHD